MDKRRGYSGEFIDTCKGPVPLVKALDIVKYYPDEDIMLGLYAYAADHGDVYIARQTRAAQKRASQGYNFGPIASPGNLPQDRTEMMGETKEEGCVGRPKKAGKKILKSFIYQAYTEEETNLRLQSLYLGLLQLKWIVEDTKQKNFLSIFSGEDTTCRVIWTGGVNTLAELFKELINRRKYVKLPEGESIWVMVNARFWDKKGNHEFGNDRLRSTSTPTGSKDAIDLFVKIMNPDLPLESLKELMQGQR